LRPCSNAYPVVSVSNEVEFDLIRPIGLILQKVLDDHRYLAPELFQRVGFCREALDIGFLDVPNLRLVIPGDTNDGVAAHRLPQSKAIIADDGPCRNP
jgi:hypothetical protein